MTDTENKENIRFYSSDYTEESPAQPTCRRRLPFTPNTSHSDEEHVKSSGWKERNTYGYSPLSDVKQSETPWSFEKARRVRYKSHSKAVDENKITPRNIAHFDREIDDEFEDEMTDVELGERSSDKKSTRQKVDGELNEPIGENSERKLLSPFSKEKEGDHFDFALVLQCNSVYEYWAKHLDFREEHILEKSVFNEHPPQQQQQENTETTVEKKEPYIFKTPSFTEKNNRRVIVSQRKSLFERALEKITPPKKLDHRSPLTPTRRRRWGNEISTEESPGRCIMSPPIRSIRKCASLKKIRNVNFAPEPASDRKRAETPSSDREEDFPSQVIPRGIAARSNGMQEFLQALARGVVVRRHRSQKKAIFVKLISYDGGDTIRYEYVTPEEAHVALKEQGVRYNRKRKKRTSTETWNFSPGSHVEQASDKPDHIAAKQYREELSKVQGGLGKVVSDYLVKYRNSGFVKTAEFIAVHPARHNDPTTEGELGTRSLRLSLSPHEATRTFSLILPSPHLFQTDPSDSWFLGEDSSSFHSLDLEAPTDGEYWLVFRGFLLLHRDAASGRFAAERAKGFTSLWNRRVVEERERGEVVLPWSIPSRMPMRGETKTEASNNPPPSDYFLGFYTPGTQIWSRLRQAGLETQRVYALDTKRVMIKVRCPALRLQDVAEVLRMKLRTRDGTFVAFEEGLLPHFLPRPLFRSSERQTIIDFIIRSRIRDSGAELGERTDLGKNIEMRIPLHFHEHLEELYGAWVRFWEEGNWIGRDGRSMTAGKDEADITQRNEKPPSILVRVFVGAFHQPLDSIQRYYGEGVAFYFAWLQHCSYHLVFLAVLGSIVFICQVATWNYDHPLLVYFSVIVMLWSFIVMATWRRRQNFLAHRWGTLNYEEEETTRPQFKGEYRRDEITQEWIVYYPAWKRWLKYCISFPLTLAFTFLTLFGILTVYANRDLLLSRYYGDVDSFSFEFSIKALTETVTYYELVLTQEQIYDPVFWIITLGIPTLVGLCLPLLNFILMRISMMLNDFENYRTENQYRNHLIIKVFAFRLVCYFSAVYYYTYLSTMTAQATGIGIVRVCGTIMVFLTVAHWWNVAIQVYFPRLIHRFRLKRQRSKLLQALEDVQLDEDSSPPNQTEEEKTSRKKQLDNRKILLEQSRCKAWEEAMLPVYNSLQDYILVVIYFGYVTCFSTVLTITPLMALINNLLTMRLDAYKLCKGRRRPLAHKAGGIGVWDHCLHIVTVIAVLTNCAIIALTTSHFTSLFEKIGDFGLFVVVVGWEHVMLFIKYVLQAAFPKMPKSVIDDLKRERYTNIRERNSYLRAKKAKRSSRAIVKEEPPKSKMKRYPGGSTQRQPSMASKTQWPPRSSIKRVQKDDRGRTHSSSRYDKYHGPDTPTPPRTALDCSSKII